MGVACGGWTWWNELFSAKEEKKCYGPKGKTEGLGKEKGKISGAIGRTISA
jgi:hypothetical protein